MAVPNPCCCCTLKTGTQVVAIVNMVISGIFLVLMGFQVFLLMVILGMGVGLAVSDSNNANGQDLAVPLGVLIVVFIIAIVLTIVVAVDLIASILLFNGASKRDIKKCRIWIIVQTVFMGFTIARTIMQLAFGPITSVQHDEAGDVMQNVESGANVGGTLFGVLIVLYEIWVVYAYIDQLKREEREGGTTVAYQPAGVVYSKPEDGPGYASPPPGIYPQLGTYPQQEQPHPAYPQQPLPYPQPPPYSSTTKVPPV